MKKYLFGILAVVLAIGFSAFTTKKVSTFINDEFVFVGDPRVQSEVIDHTKWLYVGQSQTPSNELLECESSPLVCDISASVPSAQTLAVFDANSNYSLSTSVTITAPTGNPTSGYVAQFSHATYTIDRQFAELAE
jgi:hypothetical protein